MLHVLTHYCPIFSAASIDLNSSVYIFRTLQPHRKDSSYTLGPRRLSYTRCRELVKESRLATGINSVSYSTHSLRSGGATFMRGEEQNREEGEMAQKKLGGGRNRGKK